MRGRGGVPKSSRDALVYEVKLTGGISQKIILSFEQVLGLLPP